MLASHYINQYNATLNHSVTGIADDVMDFFYNYPWEGNVRELKNVIEYACTIKTSGDIAMCDIPDYMFLKKKNTAGNPSAGFEYMRQEEESQYIRPHTSLANQMDALEKDILKSAFERNRYNVTRTAEELQISRQTLYNKLSKYGLF